MRDDFAVGRFLVAIEAFVEMNLVVEPSQQNLAKRDPAHRAMASDRVNNGELRKIDS